MESSGATAVKTVENQPPPSAQPRNPKVGLARFDAARDLDALAQTTLRAKAMSESVDEIVPTAKGAGLLSRLRNVVATEEQNRDPSRTARQRMAVLRRYAALMTGIVAHPGMNADDSEKAGVLRRLIVQTDRVATEFSRRIAAGLNLDSTSWLTDMIARTSADLVAARWFRHQDTDLSALYNEVAQVIPGGEGLDDMATFAMQEKPAAPSMDGIDARRAAFRMSLLKDLTPLLEELMHSKLKPEMYRRWMEQIRDAILDQALADPALKEQYAHASTDSRVMLIQNHLGCASKVMRMVLQMEIDRTDGRPNLKNVIADWGNAMSALTATVDVELNQGRIESVMSIGSPKVG